MAPSMIDCDRVVKASTQCMLHMPVAFPLLALSTASRLEQAPMSVLAAKFNTLSSCDLDFEAVQSGRQRKQQGLISGHSYKVSIS